MKARLLDAARARKLKRVGLVVVAVALVWQILTLQLSDFFVDAAVNGDSSALQTALWWDAHHPLALAMLGADARGAGRPDAALSLLRQSIGADPANARPQVNLALQWAAQERIAAADRLAHVANSLMPVDYVTQLDLAAYWAAQQQLSQAVQHLAVALVGGRKALREQYFLQLMLVAATEEGRAALRPIAANPAMYPWWQSFFWFVMRNAQTIETAKALVALREASVQQPLSGAEREAYIGRLRQEGLMADAYLYWVNGLDKDALQYLGYLFDGGFERPITRTAGFGWRAAPPPDSGIRITRGATYGVTGENALRIAFSGKRLRFRHLSQHLYLDEGVYVLSGRARPDNLKARRGLQWRVACNAGVSGLLGHSEAFSGSGDWRAFAFEFTVPAGCTGQVLSLRSVGRRDVDHDIKGTLWMDALRIERKR